jgi:hypothetical protein
MTWDYFAQLYSQVATSANIAQLAVAAFEFFK